jgi:tetratricopeptide (TPR) repeat protein
MPDSKGIEMTRRPSNSSPDALDRAQDLVYDAWEAGTAKRRVALAEKALALSPFCADAYVLLAEHAEAGSDKELDLWRRGLEAGTNALGDAAFEEYVGQFWGFLETRPYMRARFGLARALWERGIRGDAIDHLREMLRLNPNDNQGARYVLAAFLVEADRDEDLSKLLEAYPDDRAAAWSWTAALAAFRRAGDNKASRAQLAKALADNAHVPAYLLGERSLPKRLPPYISPGDEDEAIHYALDFRAGWVNTPGAIDWLRAQAAKPKAVKRAPTSRSRFQ